MLFSSFLKIVFGIIIAIPLLLYPFLYFAQEQLIFMQRKMDSSLLHWIRIKYPNAEEVQIKTPDNITLHGWYVKNSPETQSPLSIYFGGNAEEISEHIIELDYFKNWSLLLINYRGYGLSEGSPTETNLFNDALLVYDTFSKRPDIDPKRIIAFGRSLGTGVAVYLASQRPLKGVILVSPYDSLTRVAQNIYPYAPISRILKHHFDSITRAPSIKIPLLALIAEKDRTILPSHSFALIKAWGGTTQQKMIPNTDHNNITLGQDYWKSIREFLDLMHD